MQQSCTAGGESQQWFRVPRSAGVFLIYASECLYKWHNATRRDLGTWGRDQQQEHEHVYRDTAEQTGSEIEHTGGGDAEQRLDACVKQVSKVREGSSFSNGIIIVQRMYRCMVVLCGDMFLACFVGGLASLGLEVSQALLHQRERGCVLQ